MTGEGPLRGPWGRRSGEAKQRLLALGWAGAPDPSTLPSRGAGVAAVSWRGLGAGGWAGFSLSPGSCAARAPGRGVRHSTRNRISTTSRTAKSTAMAHHWRRSLVM